MGCKGMSSILNILGQINEPNIRASLESFGKSASSIVHSAYKAAVPVNARILIDTARGVTSPITEADFSPEELTSLRSLYEKKQQGNAAWKARLTAEVTKNEADYNAAPEMRLVDSITGKPNPDGMTGAKLAPMPYADYVGNKQNAIASFDRTKDKTSISYSDYDGMAAPTFDSPMTSIHKSYVDPAYRLKTILGNFTVKETPDGPIATDTYKFDAADYYNSTQGRGKTLKERSNWDIAKNSNGLVDALDQYMIKHLPGSKREVRIVLPPKQTK